MASVVRIFSLYIVLTIICSHSVLSNDTIKIVTATRTYKPPKIDGIFEETWYLNPGISGFTQTNPYFGQKPSFDTKVYFLYDNEAIYLFAFMQDNYPDSILKQLGSRDRYNLNADYFSVAFDPYNKQQDSYLFGVYASGVQFDRRTQDNSYNAVWESYTAITDSGWVAEIKIPYSAIRFPKQKQQFWRVQYTRYIRRNRQESKLVPEPREANNSLLYWANLVGIENIEPSTRLSLTPYLTSGLQTQTSSSPSTLISGGTDLKFSLNESFTIDVTLLPDFSQVQSDDKYKNLTAYEIVYEEQRPFFKESVELFNKGNIFYSRRIGKTPKLFYNINQYLDSNETIKNNPHQAQLINAFKISGRNKNGLALGILNAATSNTYAIIKNENEETQKILTEPWANYNIFVIDKAFKRGNNFYFTNTNYLSTLTTNSNVCASGLTLTDKKNIHQIGFSGATSLFYKISNTTDEINKQGYRSTLNFSRINGKIKYGLLNELLDKNFNANKLGLTLYNNFFRNNSYITYHIYEPTKHWLNYGYSLNFLYQIHLSSRNIESSNIKFSYWGTTHNYTSIWIETSSDLYSGYDYYEARMPNFYFRKGIEQHKHIGISTDYRKKFAIDVSASHLNNNVYKNHKYNIEISPLGRLSDHFSYRYNFDYSYSKKEIGFAAIDYSQQKPIFGKRNVISITNTVSGNYFFKNDLSINLRLRHYISQGEYHEVYYLNENGHLSSSINDIHQPSKFNFFFHNITADIVFSWQFAPGSNIMLIWKNEIFQEGNFVYRDIFMHFSDINNYPQKNTLLLKILYYLDYEYLFKRNKIN